MTDYRIALFVHVVAAFALFGGSAVLHLALYEAREAQSVAEARRWSGVLRRFSPLMPVFTVLLFLPAVYLVQDTYDWSAGWIQVAAVTLGLTMLVGPLVLAPRLGALDRELAAAPEGSVTPAIAGRLTDPVVWLAEQGLTGAFVGELALMAFKPTLVNSVVWMVACTGVGLLTALLLRRRHAPVPPAGLATAEG